MKKILGALLLASASLSAAGAFQVAKDAEGRWSFIDPQGKVFISKGCGVVVGKDGAVKEGAAGYDALKSAPSKAAWAKAAAKRLKRYGFNTLGSWSDEAAYGEGLAFTHMLALTGYDKNRLVGVWGAEFKSKVEEKALAETAKWKSNPQLLGYYLDNELPWYGDTGWPGPQNTPLLNKYLALPEGPDHSHAEAAVKKYYQDSPAPQDGEYPQKLLQSFAGEVAEQYFAVCSAALKKADPAHLNLGARFAGSAFDGIVRACGKYCDVLSLNMYSKGGDFDAALADRMYLLSGSKPLLITEFSYRAMQNRSGDRNTAGADVTVETQAERAEHLKRFVSGGLNLTYLIGYHWFQYADESPAGRSFDGEDSDYGIVDIHDKEYEELREAFIDINHRADGLHAKSDHVVPLDAAESREPHLRVISAMTSAVAARKDFVDFADCTSEGVNLWNEATAKGHFDCQGKALHFDYDSGTGWGLGLGFAPRHGDNSDGSLNALGYAKLEVSVNVEAGKHFVIYLGESGIGGPDAKEYKGVSEADGESWESPRLTGSGKMQAYLVNLADLQPRSVWGNQHGNHVIDIEAVKSLDLYVSGGQGSGKISLERLVFLK